jgi:AcrR family transcriptional regulator
MTGQTRRAQYAAATREALLDAARELFAEHGYTAVSTEQVVSAARVTRGALYHHFADKRELMAAVFASVDHALVARVRQRVQAEQDPWKALELTVVAFFDELGRDPAGQRIIFTEAPAALGWARWRELDGGRSLQLVVERLHAAITAGLIAPRDPIATGHLLMGAVNEAGMFIAAKRNKSKARAAVQADLLALIAGLRAQKTKRASGPPDHS